MKVAIYMEGGGDRSNTKAALRQGTEAFLVEIKNACRKRRWDWELVCCGSRGKAYNGFKHECASGDAAIVALLVDSETPVNKAAAAHLTARDGWDFQDVDDDAIHLMVQTMETWLVADPIALSRYYGQGFQENALPRRQNLEEVSKGDIENALERATEKTQKGEYHKIKHARELLQNIDPETVRRRCPHCERLFKTLLHLIETAP